MCLFMCTNVVCVLCELGCLYLWCICQCKNVVYVVWCVHVVSVYIVHVCVSLFVCTCGCYCFVVVVGKVIGVEVLVLLCVWLVT